MWSVRNKNNTKKKQREKTDEETRDTERSARQLRGEGAEL